MKSDVVIVGGGPGGTTAALCLAAQGVEAVIVEKDEFPRFHIGESMTGECGALVRRLGLADEMERRGYPIKNATDVYGANGSNKFRVPVMARGSDGELAPSTTWQVRRADFDQMLLEASRRRGVEVVSGTVGRPIVDEDGAVTGVEVEQPDGTTVGIEAPMVLDASGRGTWAARAGLTGPRVRGGYAAQTAVFTHVRGALRDAAPDSGNTLIFYSDHLHWAWFIPIDDEVTSVGVVAPNEHLKQFTGDLDEYFESELKTLNPELARRVTEIELVEQVQSTANFSYEVKDYVGPGFVSVGDAHRFIDPIFSFGLYIAMAEAESAAGAVAATLSGAGNQPLHDHRQFADRGQDKLQSLVDGFWANPLAFGYMVHQSQYSDELVDLFAGRIYSEQDSPALEKLDQLVESAARANGA